MPYGIFIKSTNKPRGRFEHFFTNPVSQMGADYPNTIGVIKEDYDDNSMVHYLWISIVLII